MTAVTPKQLAASALTLLLMAADAMTSATRPSSAGRGAPLEQVEAYASSLETGETAMHTIAFEKGREYHLEATCGEGCNVDLQLFSPFDREIDRHVAAEGTPEVAVIPSNTASYQAEVTMTACRLQPCAYTLAVFAR